MYFSPSHHESQADSPTDTLFSVEEAAIFLRTTPAIVAASIRLGQLPGTTVEGAICVSKAELFAALRQPYRPARGA